MQPDDEVCLCFHVSKRKILNFIRIHKPQRVGRLSECFGAGTGCGWCRKLLARLFDQAQAPDSGEAAAGEIPAEPSFEEHVRGRTQHLAERDRRSAED